MTPPNPQPPAGPSGAGERPARSVTACGVPLTRGSRVRLRPRPRGDVLDSALAGRLAQVEAVEEDEEGRTHVAVTLEADEGRHFTTGLGHRFFFAPEEVEPAGPPSERTARLLVAGIGNVFLADDAFGPEVVAALDTAPGWPRPGAQAADFGIRGLDLAYRLLDGYDAAVLVDAAPRGGPPGTLYLIEPDTGPDAEPAAGAAPEAHGMDPVRVLALAGRLAGDAGAPLPRVVVLGCEPLVRLRGDEPDVTVGLSDPVRAAVGEAVALLDRVTGVLLRDPRAALDRLAGPAAGAEPPPRAHGAPRNAPTG